MSMPCRSRWIAAAAAALTAGLAGCMVGPDYDPPQAKVAAGFTEVQPPATTRPASLVSNRDVAVTEWWTTFGDPELDKLIKRSVKGNLNLRTAASRVRQARGQRGITGTNLLPNLAVSPGYQRSRGSQNVSLPLGALGSSGGGKSKAATPADVAQPVSTPRPAARKARSAPAACPAPTSTCTRSASTPPGRSTSSAANGDRSSRPST